MLRRVNIVLSNLIRLLNGSLISLEIQHGSVVRFKRKTLDFAHAIQWNFAFWDCLNVFSIQVRESETLTQELKEDLESERKARDKAEEAKRDLTEELEAMRLELIDSGSNSVAQTEALRKYESELSNLRRQLDTQTA